MRDGVGPVFARKGDDKVLLINKDKNQTAWIRFSSPAHSRSRRINFWILPVLVLGSEETNSTVEGHLKAATRSRQKCINCRGLICSPAFNTTNALGLSPHRSFGTPTSATSATAECRGSVCSNSLAETLSPPTTIISFNRSLSSM